MNRYYKNILFNYKKLAKKDAKNRAIFWSIKATYEDDFIKYLRLLPNILRLLSVVEDAEVGTLYYKNRPLYRWANFNDCSRWPVKL